MTVNRVVIELREREIVPGIAYVALSRTKTLDDIMLESLPAYSIVKKILKGDSYKSKLNFVTKIEHRNGINNPNENAIHIESTTNKEQGSEVRKHIQMDYGTITKIIPLIYR